MHRLKMQHNVPQSTLKREIFQREETYMYAPPPHVLDLQTYPQPHQHWNPPTHPT